MKSIVLDNSVDAETRRAITWQYDQAENLINLIRILKGFFDVSTKEFWDAMPRRLDITDPTELDPFALAIWGRILGVGRPVVSLKNGTKVPVLDELYRRVLVGVFRLLQSDATVDAYIAYSNYVFNGKVTVTDWQDMSLSFSWKTGADIPTENAESINWQMYALVSQGIDSAVVYPAGVKSHDMSEGPVFGFDGQQTDIGTSVWVMITGKNGTVIPQGTRFKWKGDVFQTKEDVYALSVGKMVRFVKSGEGYAYVPAGAISLLGPNEPSGASIADGKVASSSYASLGLNVYVATNASSSVADFKVDTMDNCTYAWKRNFD